MALTAIRVARIGPRILECLTASRFRKDLRNMLPRLILLLLTLAVPAQGMAIRHSHGVSGAGASGDRGRMPHFHVLSLHRHGLADRHHACQQRSDAFRSKGEVGLTIPAGCESPEDDAVYVSGIESVAQAKVKLPSAQRSVAELSWHALPAILPPETGGVAVRPTSSHGPPIFLKTVSLRI